jgi:tetratricopeptide (TPR) repeat protein
MPPPVERPSRRRARLRSGPGALLLLALLAPAALPAQEDPGPAELFRGGPGEEGPARDERFEEAVRRRYRGDVAGALELYRVFLEENPRDVAVLVSTGTAHWELGRLAEAEAWLRKAKEVLPAHVKARQFLGKLLFDTGRFREAQAEFSELVQLDWVPPDVRASGHLNLGKLRLLEGRYREAEEAFRLAAEQGDRGDKASAEKGRMLAARLRRTLTWSREATQHLLVAFSPSVCRTADAPARKAWAARREAEFQRMCATLGLPIEGPVPVYVFADDVDAFSISGQEEVHTQRYSWWFVWTLWSRDSGHDLAHQVASRCRGSRPANVLLVEGLVLHVDGAARDPHAGARRLLQAGKLPSLVTLHADQSFSLDLAMDVGGSLVAWLIGKHGLPAFLESYAAYNTVLLDPGWRLQATGQFRWREALDEVFLRGVQASLADVESGWREFLSRP